MHVFHNFHEHEMFEKSLNATFITLIPKKPRQWEVRALRLISMMRSVYKIMAKVLTIRMNQV
jgi:hypothetical protein